MPRPKIRRRLRFKPRAFYYKPRGIPLSELEEILLERDELEAVKLKDYDGLGQIEASRKMNISQSTFQRMLVSARGKIIKAIAEGGALRIGD